MIHSYTCIISGLLGGVVVSVAAFGPSGREFDAYSLLRFQWPGEA